MLHWFATGTWIPCWRFPWSWWWLLLITSRSILWASWIFTARVCKLRLFLVERGGDSRIWRALLFKWYSFGMAQRRQSPKRNDWSMQHGPQIGGQPFFMSLCWLFHTHFCTTIWTPKISNIAIEPETSTHLLLVRFLKNDTSWIFMAIMGIWCIYPHSKSLWFFIKTIFGFIGLEKSDEALVEVWRFVVVSMSMTYYVCHCLRVY